MLSALRGRVRVSMTIETDLEAVRKAFTPSAPPLAARFKALKAIYEAGIPAQAAVSPLLPCSEEFPEKLAASVGRIVLDDFFSWGTAAAANVRKSLECGSVSSSLDWGNGIIPMHTCASLIGCKSSMETIGCSSARRDFCRRTEVPKPNDCRWIAGWKIS